MTIIPASDTASTKSRRPQRKWVAPSLTRFAAGLAENGFLVVGNDGQFTGS